MGQPNFAPSRETAQPDHLAAVEEERNLQFIYCAPTAPDRPLFESRDLSSVGWLVFGPLLVLTIPGSWYARAARFLASLKRKSRAKVAAKATFIGGIPQREAEAAIFDLYAARMRSYLHLFRALLKGKHVDVACHGLEHLKAACARGRGAVLWIGDFMEAPIATKIAFASAGYRLSHLSRPEHGFSKSRFGIAVLNPVRTRYEDRFLHRRIMFDRLSPQLAHAAILRRLEENGVVSIMASAHEGRSLAEVRFLGGRLRLATGALRLAKLAGCPVLPVFTIPGKRPGSYDVIIEPPLRRQEDSALQPALAAGVADFTSRLEGYVRQWPAAWVGWRRSNLLPPKTDARS
jgi:lauroyl/myristoyl acyltransferase